MNKNKTAEAFHEQMIDKLNHEIHDIMVQTVTEQNPDYEDLRSTMHSALYDALDILLKPELLSEMNEDDEVALDNMLYYTVEKLVAQIKYNLDNFYEELHEKLELTLGKEIWNSKN